MAKINNKSNETFNVTIQSIYSDDNDNLDGIFSVKVPNEFKSNYKEAISDIGELIDNIKNGEIETADDIEFGASVVDEKYIRDNWDKILDYSSDGTSLSYIFEILGWEYERMSLDVFDADYNSWRDE